MFSKKIKITGIVLAVLVVSFFGYRHYNYGDFKRSYENGETTYEQFDALTRYDDLLFGKQYVQAVKDAGYSLDDYNLMMMERIPALTTKNLGLEVVPTGVNINIRFNYQFHGRYISVFQILDQTMKRDGEGIYYLLDEQANRLERIKLTEAEEQELTDIAVAEIEAMLQDIYESMYPQRK